MALSFLQAVKHKHSVKTIKLICNQTLTLADFAQIQAWKCNARCSRNRLIPLFEKSITPEPAEHLLTTPIKVPLHTRHGCSFFPCKVCSIQYGS